ncbi:hypothetical protein AMTR_s00046p00092380 [Amborella trichopoda]|uniref:Uncharacterized protein n=1 Tax=Amborella trichopoda TaxID=13333 RepID=U5DC29_AMBTC|nr:hypothetical protein AMTR_s00046p00092380 [Amborella trichopoda]
MGSLEVVLHVPEEILQFFGTSSPIERFGFWNTNPCWIDYARGLASAVLTKASNISLQVPQMGFSGASVLLMSRHQSFHLGGEGLCSLLEGRDSSHKQVVLLELILQLHSFSPRRGHHLELASALIPTVMGFRVFVFFVFLS